MTTLSRPTESKLSELYYDPATGLAGVDKLYRRAKAGAAALPTLTRAQVKAWLAKQETEQVFHQRRVKPYFPLAAYAPLQRVQIDLLDYGTDAHANSNYRYLFCCVDVYSKFAIVVPLKSKAEAGVLAAWKHCVDTIVQMNGFPPMQVDSDNESAFLSRRFKSYCSELGIEQHLSEPGNFKAKAVVERFNRTLRGLIERYKSSHHTQRWIDVLPQLVENYNTRIHSTLHAAPIVATEQPIPGYDERETKQARAARAAAAKGGYSHFVVGERVRVRIRKGIFDKGSAPKWSKTLHTIQAITHDGIKVSDRTSYYQPYELQRADTVQQHIPQDEEAKVAEEERRSEHRIERRITRRMAKEGVAANHRGISDEEKNQRAIRRLTRPVDRGPMLSH